jgi:hypothetical protein
MEIFHQLRNAKWSFGLQISDLASEDAVKDVDCKTREDGPGDPNPQSIPVGQHFTATVRWLHEVIGKNDVSNAVANKD